MTIKEAILWGFEQLTPTSDSARLDAELLLAHTLKKSTTFLFTHDKQPLDRFSALPFRWLKYRRSIMSRKRGVPVAYLTGHKEFYGLEFKVNRHVLVPRPDTETLVECVIEYIKRHCPVGKIRASRLRLIDVGTGSGCIPISILKNIPGLTAVATDLSWQALRVAKANARRHGVGDHIRFVWSDLLECVDITDFEDCEAVMTVNLPYLPDKMEVSPELTFEPSIALYGGSDGMGVYRRLMTQIQILRPKAIFFELFEWQIALLQAQFPGYELRYAKTMSGDARCLMMERK